MKVTWELDTENPVDQQILNLVHKNVTFIPEPNPEPGAVGPATPATQTTETPPPVAKKKRGRKKATKEKSKEELLKLGLAGMVDYLKTRKEASILECRILAKHYNDEHGEIQSILELLHNLGANNFDDLKENQAAGFVAAAIAMIEGKGAGDDDGNDEDVLGL